MKLIITKILYFFLNDINRNDISGVLHKAWGHIFNNNLTGDYVEFGVYRGATLIQAHRHLKKPATGGIGETTCRFNGTMAGFDSFEGLPEKWRDTHPLGTFREVDLYSRVRNDVPAGIAS